jgi:probable F420-dependent oxidoreductase
VKFGVHLPNFSQLSGREPTIAVARRAEELGFDSVWASDHVVLPARVESRYPYSRDGAFALPPTFNFVDPFVTLGVAAGCTERVELGITVLVVPLRNPVLTAKMVSSLDMLSRGRVILAAGVGWMREEFEALGLDNFEQRGRVTDEWLQIMRTCWEDELPSHAGQHYRFEAVHFQPKPVRRVPVWIGGHSEAAFRRAGRLGDGWHAARTTLEGLQDGIEKTRAAAIAAGRDPASLEFSMGCVLEVRDEPDPEGRGTQRDLMGTPAEVAHAVARLEKAGLSHLALDFRGGSTLEAMLATIERFSREVRPLLQHRP